MMVKEESFSKVEQVNYWDIKLQLGFTYNFLTAIWQSGVEDLGCHLVSYVGCKLFLVFFLFFR